MSQMLKVGSHQLAYTKTGNGPAVVVIHGIGGNKEDWAPFADAIAPTNTVYTIDLLGFGGSSKAGNQITIADQVEVLVGLLDVEKVDKAHLIGNSLGGWVAATFAAEHPGRTDRLVLVDAAGFKAMFQGNPPVDFYPQDLAATANLLAHVRYDPAARTPDAVARELARFKATGDEEAAAALGKGMYMSARLEDVGTRIGSPTLVVWGAEDRLFPAAIADLVTAHIRGARKVLIPAASHFPQLDNPSAFNAAVGDFLKH